MKKIVSVILCAVMLFMLTSCGNKDNPQTDTANKGTAQVYFLNFKPEVSDVYREIAAVYE